MKRPALVILVALDACGGRAQTAPSPAPAPLPQPASAPVSTRPPATSEPDRPSAADASRDAELAQQASRFLDAFVNDSGALSPNGKQVVFRSNRDGIPQLYVAETAAPGAPATRLTTTSERVGAFIVAPDGKSVVFQTDRGADENWTLWSVDLDGKNLTELTPGETLNRDRPVFADAIADEVFFSARKKDASATSVYRVKLAGGSPPERIYGTERFGVLVDVSPDGKALLYERIPSDVENYLEIVDVAGGEVRTIYPQQSAKVGIETAILSADGKRVFVATDTGAEQGVLLALDTRTGRELARYADTASPTASVIDCEVPARRNRLACYVSVGDHGEVRILDPRTLKPVAPVVLPLGSGGLGRFSDKSTVVVTWSTPNAPTDLFLVDARSGRVSPLRREPRPSLGNLSPLDVRIAEVKSHDGLTIPVNVYVPPGAAGVKFPVIVSYHGGPSGVSVVRWNAGMRFFTSLGYAWVEPNVRGSSGFGRAYVLADDGARRVEALRDIETTGRWVASQSWADKDRLVIFGGSYGGYTTLIGLTRYPDLWRAGVDLFGVVNWVTFMKTTNGLIREVFVTEIGDPERDQALLESLSPIRDVDKIRAPLFVYAGANDPRVPKSEDDQIVVALRERGVPVEYMVAPNEGHSLSRRENQIAFYSRAARFLEKALH